MVWGGVEREWIVDLGRSYGADWRELGWHGVALDEVGQGELVGMRWGEVGVGSGGVAPRRSAWRRLHCDRSEGEAGGRRRQLTGRRNNSLRYRHNYRYFCCKHGRTCRPRFLCRHCGCSSQSNGRAGRTDSGGCGDSSGRGCGNRGAEGGIAVSVRPTPLRCCSHCRLAQRSQMAWQTTLFCFVHHITSRADRMGSRPLAGRWHIMPHTNTVNS